MSNLYFVLLIRNYGGGGSWFTFSFFKKGCDVMCDVNIILLKDKAEDYKLLESWYQEEEIYSSFEQRKLNYKEIKEKYYPRTLKTAKIPVYMIEYKDKPVGIIQYKLVDETDKKLYKLSGNNIYEIDIFIGELKEHNKGIGSKAINILSQILKKEKNAELLVMCPLKNNIKAINCYKKCGFCIKDYFDTKDTIGIFQTYVLMVKEQ